MSDQHKRRVVGEAAGIDVADHVVLKYLWQRRRIQQPWQGPDLVSYKKGFNFAIEVAILKSCNDQAYHSLWLLSCETCWLLFLAKIGRVVATILMI